MGEEKTVGVRQPEKTISAQEEGERPIDAIRRMNPGKFIPTGAELAKILLERENKKS